MNEKEHTSKRFEDELHELRGLVLRMGGIVESQVGKAILAYAGRDIAAPSAVVDGDEEVDALEKSIDDAVVHVIARRQPTASDLRFIMGISKICGNLERAGDEAKKIAKRGLRISERGSGVAVKATADIRHLAEVAATLLRNALDCFARHDAAQAAATIAADENLDREFKSIVRQLVTCMMEDPRTISDAMDIIIIARAVERIGDHAKNIAEQVIYIVEGRDVRHEGTDS